MLTPKPGTTVHYKKGVSQWTAAMTFLCVDPDDPRFWIVRDGEYELDGYLCSHLALGPRPPKPPQPGTIVHCKRGTFRRSAAMKFIGVDPEDPGTWIVRDAVRALDSYTATDLALGPRPNGDADE